MIAWGEIFKGILLQKCPRCRRGQVFRGPVAMLERCPECGHRFEREPGYFVGALYASYFLAIPILGLITWALHAFLLPDWALQNVVFVAILPFLLVVPWVVRYARIVWMYIDAPRS